MGYATFENQLPALESLIKWTKSDLVDLSSTLNKIRSFIGGPDNLKKSEEIFSLWHELLCRIPVPKTEIDVNYIVRARANEEKIFSEEWQVSYNSRCIDSIEWGRFNYPKQSFFYGATPVIQFNKPSQRDQHFIICSTLEAQKRITDETCSLPHFDLTLGRWNVNTPFMVVNLCYDDIHLEANPRWAAGLNQLIDGIKSVGSKASYEIIASFWSLMSHISSMQNPTVQDYVLSSTLFNAIGRYYSERGEPVNGLSYPSAMTDKHGQNVVLSKLAVDTYLTLDEVFMYRYRRSADKSYLVYPISDIAKVVDKKFDLNIFSDEKINEAYKEVISAVSLNGESG